MVRAFFVSVLCVHAAVAAELSRSVASECFFEPNRGQAHARIEFVARGGSLAAYLLPGEVVLRAGADPVRMRLVGARRAAGEGLERLPGISSYFTGSSPSRWRAGIPQYRRVRYRDVYPGVDVVYYGGGGHVEYDFVLSPAADAAQIRLRFDGVRGMRIDAQGDLLLEAPGGSLRHRRPRIYQEDAAGRHEIAGGYRLRGDGTVGFSVAERRRALPLVIDPVLEYASYFGGSEYETATAVAADTSGNVYLAGSIATPDSDTNPFVSTRSSGSRQAALIKFSPSTNTILYFVHLGGGASDSANSLAIDASGAAYLAGVTDSAGFPLVNAFQTQKKATGVNPAGFIAKIAPDGKSLVYSSYLGGTGGAFVNSVAVDARGAAWVAGEALSADFPLAQPVQAAFGRGSQSFLAKVQPSGASLSFSTFYGGTLFNSAVKVALDSSGNAFLIGNSGSTDFPAAVSFPRGSKGPGAFAAKFTADGRLLYATLLGGNGATVARSGVVDGSGNVFLAGSTTSTDFPVVNPLQAKLAGISNGFLAKLDPQGSSLLFSTLFGGARQDSFNDLGLTSNGGIVAAGATTSPDFPTKNSLAPHAGASDAVVVEFAPAGNALVYSTLLGGNGSDLAQSIAVSGDSVWLSGYTESTNFPTRNPYLARSGGGGDMFLLRLAHEPVFATSASTLEFHVLKGGAAPEPQTVNVTSVTGGPAAFTAAASTATGGNWLTVSPPSGSVPAQLAVSVNAAGLAPGRYTGAVKVTAADGIGAATVTVALEVAAAPAIVIAGIVHAATGQPGAVAPGAVLAIFGQFPGPSTPAGTQLTPDGAVSTQVEALRVLFDGVPAPLIYASAIQVNAVAPFGLASKRTTSVRVEYQGVLSAPFTLDVTPAAPGIFSINGSGAGQGAILNEDGSSNLPGNPAKADSVITFWATGAGVTTPPSRDGAVTAGVGIHPLLEIRVLINGQPAEITYAGAAPGMVAGILQVNARIPSAVQPGAASLVLLVGDSRSQAGLTLSIDGPAYPSPQPLARW